jgi:hypothetical protein
MKNTLSLFAVFICIGIVFSSCTKPTEGWFNYSLTDNITTNTTVPFDASCAKYGGYSYNWGFGDETNDSTFFGIPK